MKKVKLSITDTDNNITVAMGHDVQTDDLIISINKPAGVTASATDINDIFADTYEHINGSAGTVTKVEAAVTALLLETDRVSENLKYKED